jgi:hypothetical protein
LEPSARLAPAERHKIIRIERPFSNFNFIDASYEGLASLRRVMSQVRQLGGHTMVVERVAEATDTTEEDEDLEIRFGRKPKTVVHRLSFFSKPFGSGEELGQTTDNEFIGYAIVKKDSVPGVHRCTRIYESVVRMSRHANNIARGTQRWVCTVMGHTFRVMGYLYAQQNDATNVCAHVALRSVAARFSSRGDMSYREMNRLAGIDHIKRTVGGGSGGLTAEEMVTILKVAGANCFVRDYSVARPVDLEIPFQKYIYGSIESGFPAIVGFGMASPPYAYHVIPFFGHTFNEDTWVHKADISYFKIGAGMKYIPSESWVSMYLAHDDNWGSNFCIPRRYLHVRPFCDKTGAPDNCKMQSECVVYVISTVPKEIKLSPIRAEVIGAEYLFAILDQLPSASDEWRARLEHYVRAKQLVVRPLLIDGSEYRRHLTKLHDWDGNPLASAALEGLDMYFRKEAVWMVELSVPELFSVNRRKVGEVLLAADKTPTLKHDFSNFVLARIPGYFIHKPDRQSSELSFTHAGIQGHVQSYACEGESF